MDLRQSTSRLAFTEALEERRRYTFFPLKGKGIYKLVSNSDVHCTDNIKNILK